MNIGPSFKDTEVKLFYSNIVPSKKFSLCYLQCFNVAECMHLKVMQDLIILNVVQAF